MEITNAPLFVLPIYPEKDYTLSNSFYFTKDEEKYVLVEIKGDLVIKKLLSIDLVFYGYGTLAITSIIREKLTREVEVHEYELSLQNYPSNLWQMYEVWKENRNDYLKFWCDQYPNVILKDLPLSYHGKYSV
ncbi:hypothetical protein [Candidatus Hodarchaeum mangrovi]